MSARMEKVRALFNQIAPGYPLAIAAALAEVEVWEEQRRDDESIIQRQIAAYAEMKERAEAVEAEHQIHIGQWEVAFGEMRAELLRRVEAAEAEHDRLAVRIEQARSFIEDPDGDPLQSLRLARAALAADEAKS